MEVKINIDNDTIENLIVNALESGECNHWLSYEVNPMIKDFKWNSVKYAEQILKGDCELVISDVESNELLGRLNKITIASGLQRLANDEVSRNILGVILSGNDDADTADYFMQMTILGQITYC